MAMVRGTFFITEQQKCTNSVYSKLRGFAVVKSKAGRNILMATRVNKAYCDVNQGILKREKDLRASKDGFT